MSASLLEIPPGNAAPIGSTLVHHNGKQYAIFEGVWSGGTFIPSTGTGSVQYPTAPMQDLSPIYNKIAALENQMTLLNGALTEYAKKVDLIFKGNDALAEGLENWSKELGESLEERFAEISQALRLLLDE